ncbi:hypothetical protein NDU88_002108 [Pleurodeles waltl]|uniref:Uncharacterized protein n=1 Tax=Pleurodeles waltl TaxID=8319 RepID=A0AAV7MNF2_PLEWA|nr:hypothetical protein NDU88_002108 [Pleurodeles waltl]
MRRRTPLPSLRSRQHSDSVIIYSAERNRPAEAPGGHRPHIKRRKSPVIAREASEARISPAMTKQLNVEEGEREGRQRRWKEMCEKRARILMVKREKAKKSDTHRKELELRKGGK